MNFDKLDKKDLVEILELIQQLIKEDPYQKHSYRSTKNLINHYKMTRRVEADLKNLIGSIPFLLLNEKLFPKNQDITNFAKQIGVDVPFADKRGKEEIIGRVISSISKFDSERISLLNKILLNLNYSSQEEDKDSFFNKWDSLIKRINL